MAEALLRERPRDRDRERDRDRVCDGEQVQQAKFTTTQPPSRSITHVCRKNIPVVFTQERVEMRSMSPQRVIRDHEVVLNKSKLK